MFFSRLKISTKLIISSAVFLVPVGVMLFFITSMSIGTIQRSLSVHEGINTLKPAVRLIHAVSEYLNVYLGLEEGNLRSLDDEISSSIRTLEREIERYSSMNRSGNIDNQELPSLLENWQNIRNVNLFDVELFQRYHDFTSSIINTMVWLGEKSGINLVTDMNTYYFVAAALSSIPEAFLRQMGVANVIRKNLHEAEFVVERWNQELLDAHALGRRLTTSPYTGNPREMSFTFVHFSETQILFNSFLLIGSDRERILGGIGSAMEGGSPDDYINLNIRLEQYEDAYNLLSDQFTRMWGFNIPNPTTVAEFLTVINHLNFSLCQLWSETFEQLDSLTQNNTGAAQRQLVLYMFLVFVSLGLAIGFVIFIARDINRSVKSLRMLFNGLNENDLTISLPINSGDEFGELMTAFNGFLDILRSTFISFKESTQMVSESVFDISSSSKEITTTANEQSTSVSEIVSTMESSKNLSEQIAFKTTEVAGLAQQTQELSSKGAELREANQDMMEDIRNQNQKIISEIRNLTDMIIRISEAIRIIDSIADQTKLIAFNASLEASSSGEAGARFSVVAAEIRRFADNVVESTHEIKQRIEEVQEASQTLIAEANNGSRQIEIGYERMSEQKIVFENIVDNSQNVATRSHQISNLSKQQELASSQIFTALKEISAGVKQFVVATSSTSRIADSLNGMSEDLKDRVEKYRTENTGNQ